MNYTTMEAYKAFVQKKNKKIGNTEVKIENGESHMYLFGNLIAKTDGGRTLIYHCNWRTDTTRERLSAFITLRKSKGQFIVNERFVWEDGWLDVNDCN